MKTIISIILTLLSISFANAQKLTPNSVVKTNHSTFKTEINKYGRMTVTNDKNIYKTRLPKNNRFQMSDPKTLGILEAFTHVFSDKRLKELLTEQSILITYYVSPEGKVLDTSYNLTQGTSITAEELELLDATIKADVSFKLRWQDTNNRDFVTIVQPIRFSRILDKTQK